MKTNRITSPLPFILTALVLLLCTCDSAPKKDDGTAITTSGTPSAAADQPAYESLPLERLRHIFENSTYMDATFYDLPVSINQSEPAQIQSTLAGVGKDPMAYSPGCKAIGHIWFQIDGKNVEEADIYFQNECVGYVWYEDNKPAYSNAMTEKGANFYLSILSQVKDAPTQ